MTRVVMMKATGGAEVLVAAEIELSPPGAGEVRIRHSAIGVNFVDIYHRTGLYPMPADCAVPGVEGAGRVEAVGADVDGVVADVHPRWPPWSPAQKRVRSRAAISSGAANMSSPPSCFCKK